MSRRRHILLLLLLVVLLYALDHEDATSGFEAYLLRSSGSINLIGVLAPSADMICGRPPGC